MASAATKTKDVGSLSRRECAEELVALKRKHATMFDRFDELKSALKDGANANFKEVFVGKGEVIVSAPHGGAFKGTFPELQIEQFQKLPEKKRQKLIDDGLVQMADKYSGPYYGSVTVKVF